MAAKWADCFDQYECHLRGCYADDVGVHGCAGKPALISYLDRTELAERFANQRATREGAVGEIADV